MGAAYARAGQRVLDIGCGDGALVRRLADDFDVVGVDPDAAPSDSIRAARLEELDEAPFDVLFASVSLHHLDDPGVAAASLRRLSTPGSTMLVREFDRMAMDHDATLRWWFGHGHEHEATDVFEADAELSSPPASFEAFASRWRQEMEHHVMPWRVVRAMLLDTGFDTVEETSVAYLFRWKLGEHVRAEEERLGADGTIRLVGRRWRGRRAPPPTALTPTPATEASRSASRPM